MTDEWANNIINAMTTSWGTQKTNIKNKLNAMKNTYSADYAAKFPDFDAILDNIFSELKYVSRLVYCTLCSTDSN